MAGREVEHALALRVDEAEGSRHFRIDPADQPIEIALADREEPRPALPASERSLGDDRCVDGADRHAGVQTIARPVARAEVDVRAGAVAEPLGVAPCQQRDALEDVAVDHRQRAAVLDVADRVHEQRARHAVQRHADVPEIAAANGEIAAEVVAARYARERLHGSHRVVGEQATQVLELGAADDNLRGNARRFARKEIPTDAHLLGVRPRALGKRNRHVDRRAFGHLDVASRERVADQRHLEHARARRDAAEPEAPVRTGDDAARLAVEHHPGLLERLPRPRIDDAARD